MKLKDLKLSTSLALAFGAVALLLIVMGGVTLLKTHTMQASLDDITERRMLTLRELGDLRDATNLQARASRDIALLTDQGAIKAQAEQVLAAGKTVSQILDRLDQTIHSQAGREALARIVALRETYKTHSLRYLELIEQGQRNEALALLFGQLQPAQNAYFDAIRQESELQERHTELASAQANAAMQSIQITVWGAGLGSLLLSGLLAFWIIRATTGPIRQAVAIAHAVAAGNLSLQFDASGRNETGQLLAALQDMQTSLGRVVATVRQGAEAVSTASAEIAQGNQDLSSRTENQASALEETSASMEQLGGTVRQNADNARQANQLSQSASEVASQGGQIVAQVVDTMRGITTSSQQIAEIIGVIDGIAFQTNILALNAAVEAARAGEQGRGFAVVASEVRMLAQRSAEAAREIKALITDSVHRVDQGSELVDRAGATMNEVVASIRRVTDIMGEISAASLEQSQGVSQVGEAVMQMDQSTQQNAAMVEQMAAAASGLNTQAQELVQAVAVFKLDSHEASRLIEKVQSSSRLAVRANPSIAQTVPLERRIAPRTSADSPARQQADESWEAF